MSVTVRDLIKNKEKYFQLKLLAGADNLDYVCSWVHMMEDSRIAEFFWGNEMVVTSGYSLKDEEQFLRDLKMLSDKCCAGVIINTSPYIAEVPERIISYCEEDGLPLLTMPWEMSITEFVRECCTQIARSMWDEEQLANAVMEMVRFPEKSGENREKLLEYFEEENGFVFLAVDVAFDKMDRRRLDHRNILRIHTALRDYNFSYLTFRQEHRAFVLLNIKNQKIAGEVAEKIYEMIHLRVPNSKIYIGIGESIAEIEKMNFGFQSAQAARKQAAMRQEKIISFQNMGFLKLFYTVSDNSVLYQYYEEVMGPLLQYEKKAKKEGVYVETLFRYLLTDCSLQKVAKAMYIHENTIYYRMNRIRDILNNNLASLEQRQPFLMAYYCGIILKIIPEYTN